VVSIFDIAGYILKTIGGEISAMKLQKLCYYSQAWHLVWSDQPLFNEDFEKWENGPVCKELFNVHRGMFYLSTDVIKTDLLSGNFVSDEEAANIDQILEDYGKYTGGQLSELVHREDPWRNTPKNEIISKDVMKQYYSSLVSSNG